MSLDLNQIYCNHYLKNKKLQGYCKNPQFESFPYPPHTALTSFHIKDSIHYNALITNNYINTTNQKEHSVENFLNLKRDFDVNKMKKIQVLYNLKKNKYFIREGVHRLSILLYKKIINNFVPIKYLDINQNNCFYFVIYEHGINNYNAICNKIEKSKIRIDKKLYLELPSYKFTDFILDIYPDNNKNHILEKNKYIINSSKKRENIRTIILLVSIDKWERMSGDKCKEIELVKRKIRNLYNPKFKDINERIHPLNKGVSHNHVIHAIDLPNEFLPIYNVIDRYSKYINNLPYNLTIAQLLTNNEKKVLNYDFENLKTKQLKFFKNKNHEMNVRIENLKDVINIFNKCNVQYWLQGKTLLGMVRDNKLIENDHDEDIGTMCENIETVCNEIIPKLKNIGFEVIRATSNNSMVSLMRNLRYIDICFFINVKNQIGYEKKFFPKSYYDSIIESNINGFNYNVPLKFKDIIKFSYNIEY